MRVYSKGLATTIVAILLGIVLLFMGSIMLVPISKGTDAISQTLNQSTESYFYEDAVLNFVPFFFIMSIVVAVVLAIIGGGGAMVGGG